MNNVIPFPVKRDFSEVLREAANSQYQLDLWEDGLQEWCDELRYHECVLGVTYKGIPQCKAGRAE